MYTNNEKLKAELAAIRDAGLYKDERVIVSKQSAEIEVSSGSQVLNFCANNYLGLSDNAQLIVPVAKRWPPHHPKATDAAFGAALWQFSERLVAGALGVSPV